MNSGIYQIENATNRKVYIGSAVNLTKRQHQHWTDLRRGKHFNAHLQSAWALVGEANFNFTVLEFCQKADLLRREQHFIDRCGATNPANGYNRRVVAQSNLGMVFSAEVREKNAAARRGVKQSPEHIESRIAPLRGGHISAEHKQAIGRANKGRVRNDVAKWAPAAFSKFTTEQAASIRAAYKAGGTTYQKLADKHGCNHGTIRNIVLGIGGLYSEKT